MDDRPLGFQIAAVGQQAMTAFRARLARLGVQPRAYAVLWAIDEGPDLSQRELARVLGLPPSRIVGLLDDLQAEGLIERLTDTNDRRTHRIRLTPTGHSRLARLRDAALDLDRTIGSDLSPQERDQLRYLLSRVSTRLGAEGVDPARLW